MVREKKRKRDFAEEPFESDLKRRPVSKWFYVFIAIVVIMGFAIVLYPKPKEAIPSGSPNPEDLPKEDLNEYSWVAEGIPEGRLTSVTLTFNTLTYANNKDEVMFVPFFVGNVFGDSLIFDENELGVILDRANNRFALEDEEGNIVGTYSFVPEKVSDNYLTLGKYNVKYRYYVPKEGNTVYFLLAKQEFDLQFGKKFWFEGTDTDDDSWRYSVTIPMIIIIQLQCFHLMQMKTHSLK